MAKQEKDMDRAVQRARTELAIAESRSVGLVEVNRLSLKLGAALNDRDKARQEKR